MKITEARAEWATDQEREPRPSQEGLQVPFSYEVEGTALAHGVTVHPHD
ncbi:MAG: hypothetical protein RL653_2450 [Pseudomonadota bacterium]